MSATVAVIGGGVAGCAAAVSAAEAGARVVLIERSRFLGGVAARGEHRMLCGLAPIDADRPTLLEPELVGAWLPRIAIGSPERRGRVWLWPTSSDALQTGLAARVVAARVDVRAGVSVRKAVMSAGCVRTLVMDDASLAVDAVIDASGAGCVAHVTGGACASIVQWPAYRATLAFVLPAGAAARVRALAAARDAIGSDAAIAFEPLVTDRWQLSIDVPPGTSAPIAASQVERIAARLGAEVVQSAISVADRDGGRPRGNLSLAEVFACRERGLCWAAWPREQHGAEGIAWTWPDRDRHGVPLAATRTAETPSNCWYVGKGMPVADDAASALRVTGTCLALGAAVGRLAAACKR